MKVIPVTKVSDTANVQEFQSIYKNLHVWWNCISELDLHILSLQLSH